MKSWGGEQAKLEQLLKGRTRCAMVLAGNGYSITAINKDTADYVEYEVNPTGFRGGRLA